MAFLLTATSLQPMAIYAFRLLNVFASSTFTGNPLCVFEDARGMDDATMRELAAQFNLSETTFILPSDVADARVRIFTPGFEMGFAGHPTIGTSQVVRDLLKRGDALTLEFKAGVVPVTAQGDAWTFTAPCPNGVRTAAPTLPAADIAALLGLDLDDLADDPIWVDTGADQLLVPLKNVDALRRAHPDASQLERWQANSLGRKVCYLFAFDPNRRQDGRDVVVTRYFYAKPGGGVQEDAGTGSACANLGGWLRHRQHALPASFLVEQGDQMGRPCRLLLDVQADGRIQVGGRALEIGRGTVDV